MDYVKPFTYFAFRPGGFKNALLAGVCGMIPVVGPIVVLGYQAESLDEMERDPELVRHNDFDFQRFAQYLERGVWPFLVQLAYILVIMFLMVLMFGGLYLVISLLKLDPAIMLIGAILGSIVLTPMNFVVVPFRLHADKRRKLEKASIPFAKEFLKACWLDLLLMTVVFSAIFSMALTLAFVCTLGVGLFLVGPILGMAFLQGSLQVYRKYLEHGGTPIPDFEFEAS